MRAKLDVVGMVLSIGCVIHCLLFPIILPLLPFIGFTFNHESGFHLILAAIISFTAALALAMGYRKHKMYGPLVLASFGVVLITIMGIAEIFTESPIIIAITVVGSAFIIMGHYFNHKYLCKCGCGHHRKGEFYEY